MHSHRLPVDTDWASAEMDLAGGAAALIRQQARDIDELWGRLSRAYLAVRREIPRSIATFSPSTKPISLSPRRNPRIRSGVESGDLGSSNPITGMAGCCPRAPNGHDAAAPPRSEMNWRRCIRIRSTLSQWRVAD